MKFNETMSGPKLSPEMVVGITIGFAVLIIILKFTIF
jgi:preprotein translocase subunit Sec61beta